MCIMSGFCWGLVVAIHVMGLRAIMVMIIIRKSLFLFRVCLEIIINFDFLLLGCFVLINLLFLMKLMKVSRYYLRLFHYS